ncbi:glycosyltransferase family A protein [Pedobacter aquatilis]|uniref:glycosyltransferase family 2 protein n=1 Tax=Pedobacter aquatilis TaxID=351343 RepID=UPI00292D71F9|nr:glycosyltransferase family A protein [Pedobacter aquatilis]
MDKTLVSIIMPAYNAEKFIKEAIESVVLQTYKNWELIIVDDGSTDSTAAIIKEFTNINHRIHYYYQENGKQGKARNLGIKNSHGELIAFLDADDIWVANKLEIQLNLLKENESIDLLFTQGFIIENSKCNDCNLVIKDKWDLNNFEDFLLHNQIPILSVLMKKEALVKVGFFSEQNEIQNAEDYHLWLKLLLTGYKFRSTAHRLFYYRIHPSQSTFQNLNISQPIFYTLCDIYDFTNKIDKKKTIVNKLKWQLFNPDFHQNCIAIISDYLSLKKLDILSFLIGTLLSGNSRIQQKIAFKIVSIVG